MIHPNTRRILNKAKRHATAQKALNAFRRQNRDAMRSYYAATQATTPYGGGLAAQNDAMSIWRR